QRSKGPPVAVPRIVGAEVRAVGLLAPTRAHVPSGSDRPEFVEADHRAARRRLGVEPDDGALFSAKAGSLLSNHVRGFCHLRWSVRRIRRIWLRLIGTPSLASSSCRRSRVQWQVGGTSPSAGLGRRPRALATTRL